MNRCIRLILLTPAIGHTVAASEPEIAIQPPENTAAPVFSMAASAGTLGLGGSIGYRFNPHFGIRLRGAALSYHRTETWGSEKTRLQLNGDNAGLMLDYYPFGGKLYFTAGLTLSESNMRYRAQFYRKPGGDYHIHMGGFNFQLVDDTRGEISGTCSWNKLQPYLGIGYTDLIWSDYPLYYSLDLGLNYMGSGKLRTATHGHFIHKDPATNQWSEVTPAQIEAALRREGRDFFKIANRLHFYPVVQFSIGLQF